MNEEVASIAHLNRYVAEARSSDVASQLKGVTSLRQLVSVDVNPQITEVLQSGILPHLIQLMRNSINTEIQFECCWAITNVASGTTKHAAALMECNPLPILLAQLQHPLAKMREQTIWALSNLAGDCVEHRDLIIQHELLQPLLALVSDELRKDGISVGGLPSSRILVVANAENSENMIKCDNISLLQTMASFLCNICNGDPPPPLNTIMACLPTLRALLSYVEDVETLASVLWALSHISSDQERIDLILDVADVSGVLAANGVVKRFLYFMGHANRTVALPALHAIGNIVLNHDLGPKWVVAEDVFSYLKPLLSHNTSVSIRKDACWVVSNIASQPEHVQAVLDADLVEQLIHIIHKDVPTVRSEALWVISNCLSFGNIQQVLGFFFSNATVAFFNTMYVCFC